jgi:hypothetical protein
MASAPYPSRSTRYGEMANIPVSTALSRSTRYGRDKHVSFKAYRMRREMAVLSARCGRAPHYSRSIRDNWWVWFKGERNTAPVRGVYITHVARIPPWRHCHSGLESAVFVPS